MSTARQTTLPTQKYRHSSATDSHPAQSVARCNGLKITICVKGFQIFLSGVLKAIIPLPDSTIRPRRDRETQPFLVKQVSHFQAYGLWSFLADDEIH